MLQWMRKKIADWLQALYEANRVPETWGSPSVSRETFEQLRERGFFAAGRYLFGRLREVGRPEWSPARKFVALIVGIGLVVCVNAFLHTFTKERRPEVTAAGRRQFSPQVPAGAVLLYAIGASLLVAQNGEEISGGGSGGGYEGTGWDDSEATEYRPYKRRDEEDGGVGNEDLSIYEHFDPNENY